MNTFKSPLNESMMYMIAGIISLILMTVVIILAVIIRRLGGCGTKTSPLDSLAPSSPPPSPQPSLPPYKQSTLAIAPSLTTPGQSDPSQPIPFPKMLVIIM